MKNKLREEQVIIGLLLVIYLLWAVGQGVLTITYGIFVNELFMLLLNDIYYGLLLYIIIAVVKKSRPENIKWRNFFLIGIAGVLILVELLKALKYGMMAQTLIMLVPVGLILSLLRAGGKKIETNDRENLEENEENQRTAFLPKAVAGVERIAIRGIQAGTICIGMAGLLLVSVEVTSVSSNLPHMSIVEEVTLQGMLYGQQDLSQSWWKMERNKNQRDEMIYTDDLEVYEDYQNQIMAMYEVPYISKTSAIRPRIMEVGNE